MGTNIVFTVKSFFDMGSLDKQLINTNIVLIPKKKSPATMSYLRTISLCNVVYKIISNVLAYRLKKVIDSVITDT